MKLKTITKEEAENMSYDDLAYVILSEKGKKMKTVDIFKVICDLQGKSETVFETQIADFFTLLATEKRFIQLPKGYWDLLSNHSVDAKIQTDDTEEEEIEIDEEIIIDENDEEAEKNYYDNDEENDDDIDDGLKDLVVMDELEEDGE